MQNQMKINWVSWKSICRPVEHGGLGIYSIPETNRALLSKWLWKFGLEDQALWRRVVAAKYGVGRNGWSSFWAV